MRRYLLALLLVLAGCGSLQDQYVDADRATYQAIWSEYEAYFEADRALSEEQRKRRRRTGKAWRARISEGVAQ